MSTRRVATHEASHAVAAIRLGLEVSRVSVRQAISTLGTCSVRVRGWDDEEAFDPAANLLLAPPAMRREVEHRIAVFSAGLIGEELYGWSDSRSDAAAGADEDAARELSWCLGGKDMAQMELALVRRATRQLLTERVSRRMIDVLAPELQKREVMSGTELQELFDPMAALLRELRTLAAYTGASDTDAIMRR